MSVTMKFVRCNHSGGGERNLSAGPVSGLMRCANCGALLDYDIRTGQWNPGYLAQLEPPIASFQMSDDGGRTWRDATNTEKDRIFPEWLAQRKETA